MQKSKAEIRCTVKGYPSYCPSVWIFQSRGKNNKINRLRERRLRIIYGNKKFTFIELLRKGNSVFHKRNLRFLAIDMFKFERGLAPVL